jgi:NAD(P)H dehydrogenase (quinone)
VRQGAGERGRRGARAQGARARAAGGHRVQRGLAAPRGGHRERPRGHRIDTLGPQWAQGQLVDKVYSGFTSTSTAHGGQESTLLALYNTIHHFGGVIVTPGYTDPIQFRTGNPYGPSHVDGQGSIPISEETRQATQYAGQRIATVTRQLVAGRSEVAAI